MSDIKSYHFGNQFIRLPVRMYPRPGPVDTFDLSDVEIIDCIDLRAAWWIDAYGVMHRCFYCDRCHSHFFGSCIEDFHHRCTDANQD